MAFDLIINTNNSSMLLEIISDIVIPLAAAGVGAWGGCALNQKILRKNEFISNIQYLNYINSISLATLDSIKGFKETFIEPEEIQREISLMKIYQSQSAFPQTQQDIENLKQKFLSYHNCRKHIITPEYSFPVDIEKLNILTSVNTDIFSLILEIQETLSALNTLIISINKSIKTAELDLRVTAEPTFYNSWHANRISLEKTVNKIILCLTLLILCMNKAGTILEKNKKDKFFAPISTINIEDEASVSLKNIKLKLKNWASE